MYHIELFPPDACRLAADPTNGSTDWRVLPPEEPPELDLEAIHEADKSVRRVTKSKWSTKLGPAPPCTLCSRCKTNTELKPPTQPLRLFGGEAKHGTMLVVTSSYAEGVNYINTKLRTAGWAGVIYVDITTRCGTGKADAKHIDACRTYLAHTIKVVRPTHILACGTAATRSLTGRTTMVHATRGAWQVAELAGRRVPIVLTCSTVDAMTNKFYEAAFEDEVNHLVNGAWDMAPELGGSAHVVESVADAEMMLKWAEGAEYLVFDCETHGIQFQPDFRIASIAFARPDLDDAFVVFEGLRNPAVVWHVRKLLKRHKLAGHNVNYDVRSVWCAWGDDVSQNVVHDSRLLYKAFNAGYPADLDEAAATVGLGQHKAEAEEALQDAIEDVRDDYEEEHGHRDVDRVKAYAYARLPSPIMERYVARDVIATARVIDHYLPKVKAHHYLGKTYDVLQMPACRKFFRMEQRGMLIDRPQLAIVDTFLTERVEELTAKIVQYGIDPDKPDSIRAFFEREGINAKRLTPKGDKLSTDRRALAAISSQHAAIAEIIDYRKISKLLSANVKTITRYIGSDGRVHPTFLQESAATSRSSCKDPAAHSTPGRTVEGKKFKSCFIAPAGYQIVVLDYKALEVWVAAFESQDRAMMDVLLSGADFHLETAKKIAPLAWGMTAAEVEAEVAADKAAKRPAKKRDTAKTTGLATMYGIGPEALGEQVGTTKAEAAKLINAFHAIYPRYRQWVLEQEAFCLANGYVEIGFDREPSRFRPLWQVGYPDFKRRGSAYRQAGNTPIQGQGNNFCLHSGTLINEWLRANDVDAWLMMEVHDSLVLECRTDLVPDVVKKASEIMTSFKMPLRVSVEVGPSWGEAADYNLPS